MLCVVQAKNPFGNGLESGTEYGSGSPHQQENVEKPAFSSAMMCSARLRSTSDNEFPKGL
jgi:hypothetical protein